jgi:hypothetical protein
LTLRHRPKGATLLNSSLEEIGVIDFRHGDLLNKLKQENDSLRFEVYIVEDEPESKKFGGLPISINIFGSLEHLEVVGSTLSKAAIYLQEPDPTALMTEYRNPHIYSTDAGSATPFFRERHLADPVDFQDRVEKIILAPGQPAYHAEFIYDARIVTELSRSVLRPRSCCTDLTLDFAAIKLRLYVLCSPEKRKKFLMET